MINSVKFDEKNSMLWYSTPYSDIQCMKYTCNDKLHEDSEPYSENVIN